VVSIARDLAKPNRTNGLANRRFLPGRPRVERTTVNALDGADRGGSDRDLPGAMSPYPSRCGLAGRPHQADDRARLAGVLGDRPRDGGAHLNLDCVEPLLDDAAAPRSTTTKVIRGKGCDPREEETLGDIGSLYPCIAQSNGSSAMALTYSGLGLRSWWRLPAYRGHPSVCSPQLGRPSLCPCAKTTGRLLDQPRDMQ
jgi:hypothetical protein